ncbi:membrane-associated progesterone receptor component 1-like [Ptychodera flava]|uniref:membrane-associated progesterone receptor component 1-like n=1 Tax=Ptychodera flava TaxID=63121 RepID=UPI00396A7F24
MAAPEATQQSSEPGSENIENQGFLVELVSSPLNLILLAMCIYLLYKILRREKPDETPPRPPPLPKMKKRDFTLEELKEYTGDEKNDGRVLVAVNGRVFDVTRGKKFYGPGGPYGAFAGRDASRALATFSLDGDALRDEYDDLSDLTAMQTESIREWEMQFEEKYDYVGKLLKPGEEPTEYSDEEQSEQSEAEKKDN